jgi:hypothetical protein
VVDVQVVAKRVAALRRHYAERDARHQTVYDARTQKIDQVMPGSLPEAWPKPITANAIDIAARQLAENLAPLPSINCASGVTTSDRAKRFVARKTKVAYHYVIGSHLKPKMPQACDWYLTYGSMPIVVEADFKAGGPRLRFDDPKGSYPQYDLWGQVISYTKVFREEAQSLAAKFPEHAEAIYGKSATWDGKRLASDETLLEVVKYCDDKVYLLYMPERQNLILSETPNLFGKVPVAVADKPSYDAQQRGQFDDAVYPHLARNKMALLALEATNQTIRAPLAIPTDVQKIPFGDNAVIRTNSPEKIRRVGQDIPSAAFQQEAMLGEEVQRATRTPASATGDVNASIITGQGVNALNGGYDIQIATGQMVIGAALERALELAFEMDEKFWPDAKKTVSGVINGTPFQESYTPAKDIRGDYRVSVSYGFASGMNPNQALVFLLQLRGDQLVPRDFVQRQLPMDVDVTALQAQVDNEQTTDALKQGLYSMLASMGIMAQQGMDPTQLLRQAALLVELREKGTPMHEAILKIFEAPPAPSSAGASGPGGPGADEGGAGVPFGMNPATGLPGSTAPGQAQMGPGGKPDLQTMLASLSSSGRPNLSASVKRSVPA